MKKTLIFLSLAAVAFASCNGGFKKGEAGLLYDIHTDKSGPNIKPGDFAIFNIIEKTDADSVLYNSYDMGNPARLVIPPSTNKNDLFAGLTYLSEGDSATIKISFDSIFRKQPRPATLKGKYVVYNVKIEKVFQKGNLSNEVFQGRIESYFKDQAAVAQKAEPEKIKKYVDSHKLKLTTTSSGLQYIINKQGSGPNIIPGDTAEVFYVARLISGKVLETNNADTAKKNKMFDARNPYKSFKLPVGQQGVIPAWGEGLQLLNKGSEATLVVPSKLAYGEQGSQQIGPFTPMVFDLEVVNVIHADPNAPKPVANPLLQQLTAPKPQAQATKK